MALSHRLRSHRLCHAGVATHLLVAQVVGAGSQLQELGIDARVRLLDTSEDRVPHRGNRGAAQPCHSPSWAACFNSVNSCVPQQATALFLAC